MPPAPSPVVFPHRRVLTDKTTNALLSIATSPRPNTAFKVNADFSPSRHHITKMAGQKRTISEAEGEDDCPKKDSTVRRYETAETKDHGRYIDDPVLEQTDNLEVTSDEAGISEEKVFRTVQLSFHASQEPPVEIEETFEIHDDGLRDSQVEQMNATLLPENLSVQPPHPASSVTLGPNSLDQSSISRTAQGDSQGTLHMSSFISFSQPDTDLKAITPPSKKSEKEQTEVPLDKEERKAFMIQKAQLLRTNLQLASFKIKTGQTTTPFHDLRPLSHVDRSSSSPNEPILPPNPPRVSPPLPFKSQVLHNPVLPSPESHISALRANATAQSKLPVKPLHSLTAPMLNPTAFSARWQAQEGATRHVPGSPPGRRTTSPQRKHVQAPDAYQPAAEHFPSSPPSSNGSQISAFQHNAFAHRNNTTPPSSHDGRKVRRSGTPTPTRATIGAAAASTPHRVSHAVSLKEGTPRREEEGQLSSPPGSAGPAGNGDTTPQRQRRRLMGEGKTPAGKVGRGMEVGLTSSVVKGEAAGALVELMRSREKQGEGGDDRL